MVVTQYMLKFIVCCLSTWYKTKSFCENDILFIKKDYEMNHLSNNQLKSNWVFESSGERNQNISICLI